jgi:hypothetical protein
MVIPSGNDSLVARMLRIDSVVFGGLRISKSSEVRRSNLSECLAIDIQYEDFVEQIYEYMKVPRDTREKGDIIVFLRHDGSDFLSIPYMRPKTRTFYWSSSFRVAAIGELTVAVDDVVIAPLQPLSCGGLAGARTAFDQIVSLRHVLIVPG